MYLGRLGDLSFSVGLCEPTRSPAPDLFVGSLVRTLRAGACISASTWPFRSVFTVRHKELQSQVDRESVPRPPAPASVPHGYRTGQETTTPQPLTYKFHSPKLEKTRRGAKGSRRAFNCFFSLFFDNHFLGNNNNTTSH